LGIQTVDGQRRRTDAQPYNPLAPIILIEQMGDDHLGNASPGGRHDRPGAAVVNHARHPGKQALVR
jgi:hypothetical protein